MRKQRFVSLIAAAAIVLLGAACAKKTVVPVQNTTITTNVSVPLNTTIQPVNSSTTGDFSTSPAATTNTGSAATEAVSISGMSFSPTTVTITKGTVVTWTNNDAVTHTVSGTSDGPASSSLAPGSTYSFTFGTVGTFNYHCSIHSTMTGTVKVTE